jgi:hypothetical protein
VGVDLFYAPAVQGFGQTGVQAAGKGRIGAFRSGNEPVFHNVGGKFGAVEDLFKGGAAIHDY